MFPSSSPAGSAHPLQSSALIAAGQAIASSSLPVSAVAAKNLMDLPRALLVEVLPRYLSYAEQASLTRVNRSVHQQFGQVEARDAKVLIAGPSHPNAIRPLLRQQEAGKIDSRRVVALSQPISRKDPQRLIDECLHDLRSRDVEPKHVLSKFSQRVVPIFDADRSNAKFFHALVGTVLQWPAASDSGRWERFALIGTLMNKSPGLASKEEMAEWVALIDPSVVAYLSLPMVRNTLLRVRSDATASIIDAALKNL